MPTIERSSALKRDYQRAKATPRYRKELDSLLSAVVTVLLTDDVLPGIYRDHALAGDWAGYRECHSSPTF
jgi:mRNA interferase YafQ